MPRAANFQTASVAAIALALLSCGGAFAQQRETISVESRWHGKPLTIKATVVMPARHGEGKIPAMIIMHGSGGVRDVREFAYAREFNALGVASVVVDSFGPRGIKSTVRDQSPVGSYDMVADVVSTLKAIGKRPDIDPERIGLIGFSKGGTVTVKVALRYYMAPLAHDEAKFALLIAMYPWCGDQPQDFHPASSVPLHMLLGELDRYAGVEPCMEFGKKLTDAGGAVTLKVYAGAEHDWDVPGKTHWHDAAGENGAKCVYDEISPGTWIERSSKILVMDKGKRPPTAKAGIAICKTLGVSGGYNPQARTQSMDDIRRFAREAFKLQ